MIMLKVRTISGEVMNERSELPNSVQVEIYTAPSNRLSMTWMAMFHGKLAIPA
jgi:hypothetical protein